MDDTTFEACRASGSQQVRGGALSFSANAKATLARLRFMSCAAEDAMFADGGAIYIDSSEMDVSDCVMTACV
eukprot:5463291-Prymnesium_polylepis.1